MKRPIVTLLTDFGLVDHYVAAMKGVILGICPQAELVDISHEITPFSIPEGAYTLAQAWECFPKGTTHLAVVDPGVGSDRRPIVAEVAGHRFVAPDNGLLSMILDAHPRARVREITASRYFRNPVSQTFHGRDIFAPVAAHLAAGLLAVRVGKVLRATVGSDFLRPNQTGPNRWAGMVLKIDRFGNIITNLDWKLFHGIAIKPFKLRVGRRVIDTFYSNYSAAPAGRFFALRGSAGYVEVSLNQSNAAESLRIEPGAVVELEWLRASGSTGIR